MSKVTATQYMVWKSRDGKELLRLSSDPQITVVPTRASVEQLRDLSEACVEAARVMAAREKDAKPEKQPS